MKRTALFFCSALALAAAVSCEKDPKVVDFPIVGDLSFTASYDVYGHGSQGWTEFDKLGLYVTSDGVTQVNLKYVPASVCPLIPNEYVPEMSKYDPDNYVITTSLKAEGTAAGFKKGDHNVYVYTPYVEGADDYKAVPMPDLTVQSGANPVDGLFAPDPALLFAVAKAEVSEYSAAAIDLGEMTPKYCQMTVPTPSFAAGLVGKKITKITVTASADIVAKKAVYNFEKDAIEGEMTNTVEITVPEGGYEITSGYFGATYEVSTTYIVFNTDFETGLETEFTFTYTVDGTDYSATAKPAPATGWLGSANGNLNMYDQIDTIGE